MMTPAAASADLRVDVVEVHRASSMRLHGQCVFRPGFHFSPEFDHLNMPLDSTRSRTEPMPGPLLIEATHALVAERLAQMRNRLSGWLSRVVGSRLRGHRLRSRSK